MHIVFVCPGMPFRGDFVEKGRSLGGSETACYYMAREASALGHRVLVFTNDKDAEGKYDGVDYAWAGPQSERFPAGEYAQTFVTSAHCDALIVQRATGVFHTPHAAKVALWWLHDIALVRSGGAARLDLFQYDGVLAVSDWHRRQISETWHLPIERAHVLPNAVDRTLYDGSGRRTDARRDGDLRLLYQSRYERGIDYLIRPGGIMDKLYRERPNARLYVCGYDNYPDHMRGYYEMCDQRMKQMPNVERVGHMGKKELARFQESCDAMVYPGTFEETSCISAMEAQCAGLPFFGCAVGALLETCGVDPVLAAEHEKNPPKHGLTTIFEGGGARLFGLRESKVDEDAFVRHLSTLGGDELDGMRARQLARAEQVSWRASAERLVSLVESRIAEQQANNFSMLRSMLDKSDAVLALEYVSSPAIPHGALATECAELDAAYKFLDGGEAAHYDSDEAVADIDRGGIDVTQNLRFRESARQLMQDGNRSNVLDYGCQKGHYLWSLAASRPPSAGVRYTGIDVSPRVIAWARDHCKVQGVDFRFESGDVCSTEFDYSRFGKFDALMLGEVLEHVKDPRVLMRGLAPLLMDNCRVVITTPYGDWEGKDYNAKPGAARYHLHHFERADLEDMFGHHEGFLITAVPAGRSEREPLGSLITSFIYRSAVEMIWPVDTERKLRHFVPRQTLSYCAIVKDAESSLLRSLLSVNDIADEFVVAVDKKTSDGTREVLEKFRREHAGHRRFVVLDGESPLDVGFDAARNRTVDQARGDWILWLDADEELIHPERVIRYLRGAIFDGYGVAQHHMSADPAGVLTTDWPVRFFRRVPYLRFSGVVHEHPDDTEKPNSGPRSPAQVVDFNIVHHGYTTEAVRRRRFQRNLPLIKRDRNQNPNRVLGKMLWMRDLAHVCMFGLEQNGGQITPEVQATAREGIEMFEELLNSADTLPIAARMVRDGLEFYNTLVNVLGEGFEFKVQMHAARGASANLAAGPQRGARFLNREHLDRVLRHCVEEQVEAITHKYF